MRNRHNLIPVTSLSTIISALDELSDSDLEAEKVRHFIQTLGGSESNISGLFNVVDHFIEASQGAEALIKSVDYADFDEIKSTAALLQQSETRIESKLDTQVYQKLRVPSTNTTARLSSVYKECPLWVMFFHTTEYAHASYPQLCLQLFLALKHPDVKRWRLAHASRALRALGERTYMVLLDALPEDILSPDEYVTVLECLEQRFALNVALADGIDAIATLRKAITGRTVNRKEEGDRGAGKKVGVKTDLVGYRRDFICLETVVETLPPELPGREIFTFGPPITDEEMLECLMVEDMDDQSPSVGQTVGADEVSTGCYTVREYQRKVRRSLVPAAKANAQVFNSYSVLTAFEVYVALKDNYLSIKVTEDSAGMALTVLTMLILFTGRSVEQLLNTTIKTRMPSLKKALNAPVYVHKKGVMVVPAEYEIHCPAGAKRIVEKSLPKASALVLPLPLYVQQRLEELVKPGYGKKLLFDVVHSNRVSVIKIQKLLARHFSSLNKRYGTRLSLANVKRFLAHRLTYTSSSGFVCAALITGQFDSASQSPATYAAIGCHRLQADYQACCQEIVNEVGMDNTMPVLEIHKEDCFIGSNVVPSFAVLNALIETLIANCVQSQFGTSDTLTETFNQLTIYTAMMFAFAVGQRATYAMLPKMTVTMLSKCFDEGVLVMNEKDTGDQYHSRLVYLPECVREQMKIYLSKRDQVIALMQMAPSGRSPSQYPLLFLMDAMTITPFSLPLFAKRFKDIWPFPPNALRHALCSYLHAANCQEMVINAQMGHWTAGREPWHENSELTVPQFVQTLKHYLDPLMNKIGWRVLKSSNR